MRAAEALSPSSQGTDLVNKSPNIGLETSPSEHRVWLCKMKTTRSKEVRVDFSDN